MMKTGRCVTNCDGVWSSSDIRPVDTNSVSKRQSHFRYGITCYGKNRFGWFAGTELFWNLDIRWDKASVWPLLIFRIKQAISLPKNRLLNFNIERLLLRLWFQKGVVLAKGINRSGMMATSGFYSVKARLPSRIFIEIRKKPMIITAGITTNPATIRPFPKPLALCMDGHFSTIRTELAGSSMRSKMW
jgi:hypothetical protein